MHISRFAATTTLFLLLASLSLSACAPSSGTAARVVRETGPSAAQRMEDVDYLTRLGMLRGHLLAGIELYRRGHREQAQPHVQRPAGQLYAALEPLIFGRNGKGFGRELDALAKLVGEGADDRDVNAAYELVLAAVRRAESRVASAVASDVRVHAMIAARLADEAANAYSVGVLDGRVNNVVEYQDAYGFTRTALDWAQRMQRSTTGPRAHDAARDIADTLEALDDLWPTLNADGEVGTDPLRLDSAARRVERILQRL